jgi:hypothetical protein
MLALFIGMTGAGCRESNPAYLRIDAAKERPSNASPDSALPRDAVSVDTRFADRALPDLDNRLADAVTDARIADVPLDQPVDLPDASVDITVGADFPDDARDASIAGDAGAAPSDSPLVFGDGGSVGLDTKVDRGVDLGANLDTGVNLDAVSNPDVGLNLDLGLNLDVALNLDVGLNLDVEGDLDAEGDLGLEGDAGDLGASETGADLE